MLSFLFFTASFLEQGSNKCFFFYCFDVLKSIQQIDIGWFISLHLQSPAENEKEDFKNSKIGSRKFTFIYEMFLNKIMKHINAS